jgi:UDP-N-acetylglucosamine:LPS N-acetylglucosamine transferase
MGVGQRRFLIIGASMGAGHDAVADELAGRLRLAGHRIVRCDILDLLPAGVGPALREAYRLAVRRAPWLYAGVYRVFLEREEGPGSMLLAAAAKRPLRRLVARCSPDAVVSTFHLAAQTTGALRAEGTLPVPTAVLVTDFAVHPQWLHPGNDLQLCVSRSAAAAIRARGLQAEHCGPLVPEEYFRAGTAGTAGAAGAAGRWPDLLARAAAGRPAVLVGTGAWGVGSGLVPTALQIADRGCLPVVLCGHDERLRRYLARRPELLALGWVTDLAALMAATRALVDNAAGQTAVQALAAGLPVIGYRPIPGHGAAGVAAMASAGLSARPAHPREFGRLLEALVRPGPLRERQVAAGRTAFTVHPTARLVQLAGG